MTLQNENSCFTEYLERAYNFSHGKSHNGGAGDHPHFHPGTGDHGLNRGSHHGNGEKHNDYTPGKHKGFYKEHSHKHLHEGDPLAVLEDIGANNEFAVAENASSNSTACCYQDAEFSDPALGGDALSEMGDFSDVFVG